MTTEHGIDSNFRYVVMAARRARQVTAASQPRFEVSEEVVLDPDTPQDRES
jgi:DNA-directed RNA polymerase subunit K/omega